LPYNKTSAFFLSPSYFIAFLPNLYSNKQTDGQLQRGVAECKNRHLLDVVLTLMLESSVPSIFWVKTLSMAVYLINRLPSPTFHLDSPYSR